MKKKITTIALLLILSGSAFAQYKLADIVNQNKVKIEKPYKYDGFLMKEFSFDLVNKVLPQEFIAFRDQKYKLIFCSSEFEEQVIIRIYDKNAPDILIEEKIIDQTNRTWTFEPTKATTYSIKYEVPPSNTEVEHRAVVVMLIGFKD